MSAGEAELRRVAEALREQQRAMFEAFAGDALALARAVSAAFVPASDVLVAINVVLARDIAAMFARMFEPPAGEAAARLPGLERRFVRDLPARDAYPERLN